jgi:hypothetical protein
MIAKLIELFAHSDAESVLREGKLQVGGKSEVAAVR